MTIPSEGPDYGDLGQAHTEQATRFPALLHLCELTDEYV
jgi:hypothetical protein